MKSYVLFYFLFILGSSCAFKSSNSGRDTNPGNKVLDPTDIPEKDPTPSNPPNDLGKETQNGDWSFAERGRKRLSFALQHLENEVLELSHQDYLNATKSESLKTFLNTHKNLQQLIINFEKNLSVPSNEALEQMRFKFQSFLSEKSDLTNVKHEPQLDFFVQFGADASTDQLVIFEYQIKKTIMKQIGIFNGLSESDANSLAEVVVDTSLQNPVFDPAGEVKKLQDDQVADAKLIKIISILQAYSYRSLLRDIESFHKRKGFKFDSYEITFPESFGDKSVVVLEKSIDIEYYSYITFKGESGENEYFVDSRSQLDLIESGNSGYIKGRVYSYVSSENSKHKVDSDVGSDFTFLLPLKKSHYEQNFSLVDLDINRFHAIASGFLNKAKTEILDEFIDVSPGAFTQIIKKYADSNLIGNLSDGDLKRKYVEQLSRLTNITLNEFQTKAITIKNFDYTEDLSEFYVTPAFYVNFGVSNLYPRRKVFEVMRMIFHESGHLYGMDEEHSKGFAEEMLYVLDQKNGAEEASLYIVGDQQEGYSSFLKTLKANSESILQTQHEGVRTVLKNEGFDLKEGNSQFYISLQEINCYENNSWIPCHAEVGQVNYSNKYRHEFTTTDDKKLYVTIELVERLMVESIEEGHGRVLSSYTVYFDKGETETKKLSVYTQDEKLLRHIEFDYRSETYDLLRVPDGLWDGEILQAF